MEKSKTGLSITLMTALVYLLALFGGYTPLLLVVGFILLVEENKDLKKSGVTALAILLAFSAASFVLGLIPDLLNLVYSLLALFKVYFRLDAIHEVFNFLSNILYLGREVILVLLAVFTVLGKPIKIPFIDKLFE